MLRSFAILALVLLGAILSCQGTESVSFSAYPAYFTNSDNTIEKSGIQAKWTLSSVNGDIQHFAVKWHKASEAGAGANMESSPLITHYPASLVYDYDIEDLVQGDCYFVFLHTTYNDNSLYVSGPIVVQTNPAVPYNVGFQGNGWDASVTWDFYGEYTAGMHKVKIASNAGPLALCNLNAEENSALVCNTTLDEGLHYYIVDVTMSITSACWAVSNGKYGVLHISYSTAPETPTNVALTNHPTSPSDTLVASWENPNYWPFVYCVVVATDSNGNDVRLDHIVAYETTISGLSSSEKYSVIVQAVNAYTPPYVYSFISKRSNYAITAPSTFIISASEVLWGPETHRHNVYVSWGKPQGGEEIETYTVSWKKTGEATSSGESQIAHVKGITFFDMYVSNLNSGEKYDFEVHATNIAGSSKSNTVTVQMT